MNDVPNGVVLQICELPNFGRTEATVTVRNLRGSVFCGAWFHRASDSADPIALELTQICWYGRTVDEIPSGHTAMVTLRGLAAPILRAGAPADGW